MPNNIKIHHIALAVTDLEKGIAFWQNAMGLELKNIENLASEQAKIAFFPVGDTEIELVQPTSEDSGLAKFLEKRGSGMHHICFEVDNIDSMLAHLKTLEIELITETPKQHEDGTRYAFIHPKSTGGVLVELYQLA